MNESILNILNSMYYMSNKLIPLPLFLLFDCISIIEHSLHATKPNQPSNISTNWPLKGVLQTHVAMFEKNCNQVFHVWSIISPLRSESNSKQSLFYFGQVCCFLFQRLQPSIAKLLYMFFSNSGFFLQDPSAKVNTTSKVL